MRCETLSVQRTDPVLSPGFLSSSVNRIVGGTAYDMSMGVQDTKSAQNTSCTILEDKSNYWATQLYSQSNDNTFSLVQGETVLYYLYSPLPGTTTPFPDGFRMVAGNSLKRTYNATDFFQQAISYLCRDLNGITSRHSYLPQLKKCPNGITAQVIFPSCWDGMEVDSPDHKSHVSYRLLGPDVGVCPPSHPKTLPRIMMETTYATTQFQGDSNHLVFTFANGDTTGYGYSAGFLNGWQRGVLQIAVDGCSCNNFGDPACCAQNGIFTLQNPIPECHTEKPPPAEDVGFTAPLNQLPGNNPVYQGPLPKKGLH